MTYAHRLARLDEHQATIHDVLRRGERLLRSPDHDAAAIARTRWELARAVMAYQGFKHRELFDPIAATGDPARAATARRLKAACVSSGEAFRAYLAKWSVGDVLDRWDEYQPAALRLIADLRAQLAREKYDAEALLKEPSLTPPPAPRLASPRAS